ncbi:MAG TPA: DUF2158 domain-containing protein [Planctomycetota bacterium]|nr:DUF2158 domain-containing protein [Planctomycetota bacterium]
MSEFKQGDVVRLKSGGPDMTVENIADYAVDRDAKQSVKCAWFQGKTLNREVFSLDMLEKVEKPQLYKGML